MELRSSIIPHAENDGLAAPLAGAGDADWRSAGYRGLQQQQQRD